MAENDTTRNDAEALDHMTAFLDETSKDLPPDALREDLQAAGVSTERLLQRVHASVNQYVAPARTVPAHSESRGWRYAVWALSAALVLLVPLGAHRMMILQSMITGRDAALREEQEKNRRADAEKSQTERQRQEIAALSQENRRLLTEKDAQSEHLHAQMRALSEYRRPRVNPEALVHLDVVRQEGAESVVAFSKNKSRGHLRVRPPDRYAAYALAITDRSGKILWQDQAGADEFGGLDVTFERDSFPPGDYVLKVHGLNGGQKVFLADHRFRITVAR